METRMHEGRGFHRRAAFRIRDSSAGIGDIRGSTPARSSRADAGTRTAASEKRRLQPESFCSIITHHDSIVINSKTGAAAMSTVKSDVPGDELGPKGHSARNRRAIGFVLWLIGSALACGAIYALFPSLYRAESTIRIEPIQVTLFGTTPAADQPPLERFIETQMAMLQSNRVLDKTLANPSITNLPLFRDAKDKLQAVRSKLQVSMLPKAAIIRVALESEDPHEAAAIVNSITDTYLYQYPDISNTQSDRRVQLLQHYLHSLDERLGAMYEKLSKASANVVLEPRSAKADGEPRPRAERTVAQTSFRAVDPVEHRAATDRQREADLSLSAEEEPTEEEPTEKVDDKPQESKPVKEETDAPMSFRALDAEKYRKAADRLLQADLDLIEARNQRGDAADREARVAALKAFRNELRQVLASQDVPPAPDPYKIEAIRQEIEVLTRQRNAIAERYEDMNFARQSGNGDFDVQLLDRAVAPTAPISDNRIAYMVLASFALLVVAAADALRRPATARRDRAGTLGHAAD